jgi:putative aldouronate transport system substrate-binding protein
MKLRRIIAMGMVACFLVQGLAGCKKVEQDGFAGKKENTEVSKSEQKSVSIEVKKEGLPIVEEQQTLKVLTITSNPEIEPSQVVIHQEIEGATNVKIEWDIIPSSAWNEKKGLTLAQRELPDIMMGDFMFLDSDLLNMVEAGQVIAIDDFLDYAPNFKELLDSDMGLRESITNEDGHIYGLPQYSGTIPGGNSNITWRDTFINKKWLDQLNMELPTTTEELKKVLIAFKENDMNGNGIADEIPLSTVAPQYFTDWIGAFGVVNASKANYENISMKNGKPLFTPMTDEYKEAMKYFHELWEEGLVDPETFTQDSAMFGAKLKAETRVVGMFSAWRGTSWRLSPEDTEYVLLPPLEGPNGDKLYGERYDGITSRAGLVITSSCKNKELAMRWADNLVSPDNGYQFWTKFKIGYNLDELKEGEEVYNLIKKAEVLEPEQIRQVMLGFTCVSGETKNRRPMDDTDPLNVTNEKRTSADVYSPFYPKEHYPSTFMNKEEGQTITELQPQLNSYVNQMMAQWIVSGGVDESWDGYIKQLNVMGLERYMQQFQSALDRFNTK